MTPAAKIEREKIIQFKFESQAKDVGVYTKRLKIMRRTPRLDSAFITTKAALTGGLIPLTRGEMLVIDAIATLNVYVDVVNEQGKSLTQAGGPEEGWVDNILDQDVLFAIHKEWADYQNSFYPEAPKTEGNSEAAAPAAAPQTTV